MNEGINTNCSQHKRNSAEWRSCKGLPPKTPPPDKPAKPEKPEKQVRQKNTISPNEPPSSWQQAITNGVGVIGQVVDSIASNQRLTDAKVSNLTDKKSSGLSLTNPEGGPNFFAIALVGVVGWFIWKWLK